MKIFLRIMVGKYENIGTVLLVVSMLFKVAYGFFLPISHTQNYYNLLQNGFQVEFYNDYSFTFYKRKNIWAKNLLRKFAWFLYPLTIQISNRKLAFDKPW